MTAGALDDTPDFASLIKPGDTVAWGQAGAEPVTLTQALMDQRHLVGGRFRAFIGLTFSKTVEPACSDCIDFISYCGGGYNRELARTGVLEILPVRYSELSRLLGSTDFPIDVLLVQLAPAGRGEGYCLAIGCDYLPAVMKRAKLVIGELNDQAPWTYGEPAVQHDDVDILVRASYRPVEIEPAPLTTTQRAVARQVAHLVADGATLQIGLGDVPDAVLDELGARQSLGIHSGIFTNRMARLIQSGVITNDSKAIDRGISVASLMLGSAALYEFASTNRRVNLRSAAYVYGAVASGKVSNLVAINTALEVDLTGQANLEVASNQYIGAVGGGAEFLRGAAASDGGLPVIALTASSKGRSKIVPRLSGPVGISRSDVGIVVTEHGVADLRGSTLSQRRERMIRVADPAVREKLWEAIGR